MFVLYTVASGSITTGMPSAIIPFIHITYSLEETDVDETNHGNDEKYTN